MGGFAMWSSTNGWSGNSSTSLTAAGSCRGYTEHVVGQAEGSQPPDPAPEIVAQHETVVGLILSNVADAHELPDARQSDPAAKVDRANANRPTRPRRE